MEYLVSTIIAFGILYAFYLGYRFGVKITREQEIRIVQEAPKGDDLAELEEIINADE